MANGSKRPIADWFANFLPWLLPMFGDWLISKFLINLWQLPQANIRIYIQTYPGTQQWITESTRDWKAPIGFQCQALHWSKSKCQNSVCFAKEALIVQSIKKVEFNLLSGGSISGLIDTRIKDNLSFVCSPVNIYFVIQWTCK